MSDDWEPKGGWDSLQDTPPAIYRYATWAHDELERMREALTTSERKRTEQMHELTTIHAELEKLRRKLTAALDAYKQREEGS